MFEYITGLVTRLNPTYAVVESGGIGYMIHISLFTYSQLKEKEVTTLLLHEVIKEDSRALFGFSAEKERSIFRLLISVSGIGANTARMMLSTLSAEEIEVAIISGNVSALQKIKGIGLKTAQRAIVELKDKVGKQDGGQEIFASSHNTTRDEALSALTMLGFQKQAVEKVLDKLLPTHRSASVEELIKAALKNL